MRHRVSETSPDLAIRFLRHCAMKQPQSALVWLERGDQFPPLETAWAATDPVPGLLAAGGCLDTPTLLDAYSRGIFPWFSDGQPILWWSPSPRMVLKCHDFRLHRSLRKALVHAIHSPRYEVRIDHSFDEVIQACAAKNRKGQSATWIVEPMIKAYRDLHRAGHAHSVETWVDGRLVGGLYCVNVGHMVFGESMFAHVTDASKIAIAALVAFCRAQDIAMIDCQQNTGHLASLGAGEISRAEFVDQLQQSVGRVAPRWEFSPDYWQQFKLSKAVTSP